MELYCKYKIMHFRKRSDIENAIIASMNIDFMSYNHT
ncbi:unnamed protein product, partial [Heterotrigona itama]